MGDLLYEVAWQPAPAVDAHSEQAADTSGIAAQLGDLLGPLAAQHDLTIYHDLLPALEADYIVPDERSLSDLVEYARRVAAEIRFYDLSGQATGDWVPFLELLLDPTTRGKVLPSPQLEAALDARADWPPHLVLFLAFLKLFQHLQGDLNQLTGRHLRYYYEQHLGLRRRPGADADAGVGDKGGDQVLTAVDAIGEDGYATSDQAHGDLEDHERGVHVDRQRGCTAGRVGRQD